MKTILSPAQREASLSPGTRLHCVLLANDYAIDFESAIKLYHETHGDDAPTKFPARNWDSFDRDLREILLERKIIPTGIRIVDVEEDEDEGEGCDAKV